MSRKTQAILMCCLWALAQMSCVPHSLTETQPDKVAPLEGYGTLDRFAFREAWYGMYFKEDKIGYSHFTIVPSGDNFSINSESAMRLTAMKKTDEIQMKERVLVHPDLTLIGFQSVVRVNGRDEKMTGKIEGDRLLIDIKADGRTMSREYPIQGKIYYLKTISLMPALTGLRDGASASFPIFNAGTMAVEKVEQQVFLVRGSPGPQGAVWKAKTDVVQPGASSPRSRTASDKGHSPEKNDLELSKVSSWLDKKGLVVLEQNQDGSLITLLADKSIAEGFSAGKAGEKDLSLE